MNNVSGYFEADWAAPVGIKTAITVRTGGVSRGAYASNNLGLHVGDAPDAVAENRRRLARGTGVEHWQWLSQVHGVDIATIDAVKPDVTADGVMTSSPGIACAVLSADCLPVLLCDQAGRQVAAVHAGWRGLASGILAQAVARFDADNTAIMAYLGPAIGPEAYEVDGVVKRAFAKRYQGWDTALVPAWDVCFQELSNKPGHYLADLYRLAQLELNALGVQRISGGQFCTYRDQDRFYSYRREGITGRLATAIWIQSPS